MWVAAGKGLILALDTWYKQHSKDFLNDLGMSVAEKKWDCLTSEFEVAANRPVAAHVGKCENNDDWASSLGVHT